MNANTENRYHGINTVTLWAEAMLKGYETRYWASFKQWQQIGGQIQRGEKSTPVVFYKPLTITEENDRGEEEEKNIPLSAGLRYSMPTNRRAGNRRNRTSEPLHTSWRRFTDTSGTSAPTFDMAGEGPPTVLRKTTSKCRPWMPLPERKPAPRPRHIIRL